MSLRVLHLIHWPRSGIGALVADLMRHDSHIDFHVICLEGGDADCAPLYGPAQSVERLNLSSRPMAGLQRLRARLRHLQPDIIHTHSFQPGLWARLLAARPTPLLATIHNAYPYFSGADPRSRFKRTVERLSLDWRATRLTCVSEGVRAALPADWPAPKVIPNGVAVERLRALAADAPQPTLRMDADPLLVSVGRLEAQKGYDLLLPAIARLRDRWPHLGLLLVGDGTQRHALEHQAEQLGIRDAVEFAGFQENPYRWLRLGDLYVSSSRYEGFPLSPLEAMALGLPVVATPTAGIEEVIRHGASGFVTPSIDSAALVDTLTAALSDRQALAAAARAGETTVAKRFHVRNTAWRYATIYRETAR